MIDLAAGDPRASGERRASFPLEPFARYCLLNGLDELVVPAVARGRDRRLRGVGGLRTLEDVMKPKIAVPARRRHRPGGHARPRCACSRPASRTRSREGARGRRGDRRDRRPAPQGDRGALPGVGGGVPGRRRRAEVGGRRGAAGAGPARAAARARRVRQPAARRATWACRRRSRRAWCARPTSWWCASSPGGVYFGEPRGFEKPEEAVDTWRQTAEEVRARGARRLQARRAAAASASPRSTRPTCSTRRGSGAAW